MKLSTHKTGTVALALIVLLFLAAATAPAQISDRDVREIGLEYEQGGNGGQTTEPANSWVLLGKMFGALAFVLLVILAVTWLLRKYLPAGAVGATGRADAINIVATRMLGQRRSLVLVRVRGQTLLLGVTPQSINTLTEIDELDSEWSRPPGEDEEQSKPSSAFQRRLGQYVRQTVADDPDETGR